MSVEFLLTSIVVILLPGTGVLYTLAIGLGRGFGPSIAAAFGCTLGILPAAIASIIGLASILHTSALAFQVIKYLGVIYLFYMAWSILLTFVIFIGYGACAALARDYVISRPNVMNWLKRAFAGTFGFLGLKLALSER